MRQIIRAASLVTASAALGLASMAMAADPSIEAFEAAQQAAWNAHDAGAYTAAFDPGAAIVTAQGWLWAGQAEAAGRIGDGFKLVYARAHIQLSGVQVRELSPELASVTLRWSIDGARTIDGGRATGVQQGFETQLLQRRGASWAILAQQDTLATEMPILAHAQPAAPAAPPPPTTFATKPPPVRKCIVARANGDCLLYGKAK